MKNKNPCVGKSLFVTVAPSAKLTMRHPHHSRKLKAHDYAHAPLVWLLFGAGLLGGVGPCQRATAQAVVSSVVAAAISTRPPPATLAELLALDDTTLVPVDLARVNLLCAEGLPGDEGLDIDRALATLDDWANRVRVETARNLHLFREDPARFHGNEGEYRFKMLVTVLQQDLGVAYNPARADPDESAATFFADSRDLFLHGLTAPERHLGTCASLPVLYAAVARRLGYPVRLVTARSHLFNRWEPTAGSGQISFNLEGTNRGAGTIHPDDYYLAWPKPISPEQRAVEGYLTSLSAKGELAVFLDTRGDCLRAAGRWKEAAQAYGYAARLVPKSRVFAAKLADATGRAHTAFNPALTTVAARPESPAVIHP